MLPKSALCSTLHVIMVERIIVGPLYTNAYIVSTGKKECFIVDPGAEPESIIERLETLNMVPLAMVCTHGHLDHIAAAGEIKRHFRSAKDLDVVLGVHKKDAGFFGAEGRTRAEKAYGDFGESGMKAFEALYDQVPEPDFYIEDGEALLDTDFMIIHTPGHSPGSVCLYSETRNALFTGEILQFKTIAKAHFPDSDQAKMLESIHEKIFTLPGLTRLFPGHGPFSTIEREIANNPELRAG